MLVTTLAHLILGDLCIAVQVLISSGSAVS
jgi:hypothetical protein